MRQLLTTEQVADSLGLRRNTLEKWRLLGEGPHFIKAGRQVRYDSEDVDQWLSSRRVQSTSAAL